MIFSKLSADYDSISNKLKSVNRDALWEAIEPTDFPELFTQTVYQICVVYCPKKIPPKNKQASLVRIPSKMKRKLQKDPRDAENDVHCPSTHLKR